MYAYIFEIDIIFSKINDKVKQSIYFLCQISFLAFFFN